MESGGVGHATYATSGDSAQVRTIGWHINVPSKKRMEALPDEEPKCSEHRHASVLDLNFAIESNFAL